MIPDCENIHMSSFAKLFAKQNVDIFTMQYSILRFDLVTQDYTL